MKLLRTLAAAAAYLTFGAMPASASIISWTTWTSGVMSATAGSASGTIPGLGLTVSYTGEMQRLENFAWDPPSSFMGGTVDNAPVNGTNNAIILQGGGGAVLDTVTFSSPVVNPILAIWSLGQGGAIAQFAFLGSPSLTIEGGGATIQYGGGSIFGCSAAICGEEGNGVVQFNGTFTSISWTNPVFENYYAFTVGASETAVPEPASLVLLGSGLLGLAARRRRTA